MRTILLAMALSLLVAGCDGNKKTADVSETKDTCSSTTDYETGLQNGLRVAPPCDITNNGTYKDKCVGEYNSTTWTNCFGERSLPNGEKYRGGYLEGKANGKGEFINADGTRYLGYYEKGKRNGAGKEYGVNGKVIKVGEWSNGVFSDVAQREQTTTQENSIQSNLPNCQGSDDAKWTNCVGTVTYSSGDTYVGEFRAGIFNGKGVYSYSNGKPIEEGIWVDGSLKQRTYKAIQGQSSQITVSDNNKEEGACYATLDWKAVKGQEIGIAFNAFITKNVPRFKLMQKQIRECFDSQGRLPKACLKSKLSSTDYDFFEGYDNASVILDSPSDPNKMGNDIVLLAKYCYPLVKESLENKYGK